MSIFKFIVLLSLTISICQASIIEINTHQRFFTAHRGGMDQFPENTLEGMWASLDQGFNALEIDLQVTKDRRLVLWHDYLSVRTGLYNSKCWWIAPARKTYVEISRDCYTKKRKKKYQIRTLKDVLHSGILEDPRLRFIFLDIKVPPKAFFKRDIVEEVAIATEKELSDIDYELFQRKLGLNIRNISLIKRLKERMVLPDTPNYIHYGATGIEPLVNYEKWINKISPYDIRWVSINLTLAKILSPFMRKRKRAQNIIDRAHNDGYKVNCWTMASKRAARKAIEMGCDSVLGNKAKTFSDFF